MQCTVHVGLVCLHLKKNYYCHSFILTLMSFAVWCRYNNSPRRVCIILASLLVCPMLGCRHSLLRHVYNSTIFSSKMHIFKLSCLCTLVSRGHCHVSLALIVRYRDVLQGRRSTNTIRGLHGTE